MTDKKIGIVGIGLMGHGIAANIQKQGWSIEVLDHAGNQPIDDLVAGGASVHSSCNALAAVCDVIILCVTGSPQVEAVLTGNDGVIAGLRKNTVIIDCSTAIPASTIKLASIIADAGGRFLDAPMTRTPKEAAEGRLNLIVGGDQALFDEQLPLLQSFAENITHAGGIGAGHTMKLLHNYVSLGYATVLAEAAAAANEAGIEPEVLHDVLAKGGGGGVVLDRLAPFFLEKDASALAFSLSNSAKDLNYYTQMCGDLGASRDVAVAISELLSAQVDAGHGNEYVPALIDLLSKEKI